MAHLEQEVVELPNRPLTKSDSLSINPFHTIILAMSAGNLLDVLVQAAQNGPENGMMVYDTAENERNPPFMTYETLLAMAKQMPMNLRQLADVEGKVVLMYFSDHLDNIKWFWAIVAAGAVPCICPPLSNDSTIRLDSVTHLRKLLNEPLIITSKALAAEFKGLHYPLVFSTSKCYTLLGDCMETYGRPISLYLLFIS
jgi:acyl-CoA synthetase (AMP-forming)/AMP-acid ligase II